jgi:hypothetical protein
MEILKIEFVICLKKIKEGKRKEEKISSSNNNSCTFGSEQRRFHLQKATYDEYRILSCRQGGTNRLPDQLNTP